MRKLASLLAAAVMMVSQAAAQDNPVVVELFTSQGCSSCPPADAFLHDLAAREDVVALAMHVDYWDYIGWKDSFASPENTKRQRSYARAGERRMIYTPQMIINGQEHVVGNRPRDVIDLITMHKSKTSPVALEVTRAKNKVTIEAQAEQSLSGELVVQLVQYRPKSVVDIKRGENAGRTLSYANVVTQMDVLGYWDTKRPLSLEATAKGDGPVVVLVQHKDHGPMVAVARLK